MSVLLRRGATTSAQIDGNTEDADASVGAGGLLELGVEGAGSWVADGDLITKTGDDDDLADAGKGLNFLGSVGAELVLADVGIPEYWMLGFAYWRFGSLRLTTVRV